MKGLKSYIITGIIFVSVLGTLLHFAYEFSGNNFFVGLFAPVNESIFEHTKLIFFPMLIYSLINKKIKKRYPCISSSMKFSSLLGIFLIIILFYTYSGIIGNHFALADILIFYISVILSFVTSYKLTLSCKFKRFNSILNLLILVMVILYIIFTLYPPNIPLFISK